MNDQRLDPDLGKLFQELRAEDQAGTPSFANMMARAKEDAASLGVGRSSPAGHGRRSRELRRLAWGGSLLAAAAAAVLLLLPDSGTTEAEFEMAVRAFSTHPAGGAWRSPTDGLLDLPGSNVLSTLPSVGSPPWPLGPGTTSRPNHL
jgi:hypothetical protein